jgi:hypothetical protein
MLLVVYSRPLRPNHLTPPAENPFSKTTFSRQHQPKNLSILKRDIYDQAITPQTKPNKHVSN